jgi:hypothetical protein
MAECRPRVSLAESGHEGVQSHTDFVGLAGPVNLPPWSPGLLEVRPLPATGEACSSRANGGNNPASCRLLRRFGRLLGAFPAG